MPLLPPKCKCSKCGYTERAGVADGLAVLSDPRYQKKCRKCQGVMWVTTDVAKWQAKAEEERKQRGIEIAEPEPEAAPEPAAEAEPEAEPEPEPEPGPEPEPTSEPEAEAEPAANAGLGFADVVVEAAAEAGVSLGNARLNYLVQRVRSHDFESNDGPDDESPEREAEPEPEPEPGAEAEAEPEPEPEPDAGPAKGDISAWIAETPWLERTLPGSDVLQAAMARIEHAVVSESVHREKLKSLVRCTGVHSILSAKLHVASNDMLWCSAAQARGQVGRAGGMPRGDHAQDREGRGGRRCLPGQALTAAARAAPAAGARGRADRSRR